MKIAFHFDVTDYADNYAINIVRYFSGLVLPHRSLRISSKFLIGDLLLHNLALDPSRSGDQVVRTFNKETFTHIVSEWVNTGNHIWCTFDQSTIESVHRHNVFVLCAESIDLNAGQILDEGFKDNPHYIGAIEVDV